MRKKLVPRRHLAAVAAFVSGVVLGYGLLAAGQAATYMATSEAEDGTRSGEAVEVTDTTASGGSAVRFGKACVYPPPGTDNAHIAFDFFVTRGFTIEQSAGIIGNLMQESHVDPTAVQNGGPGRGIAQWSVGARWQDLLDWKGSRDEWALQTQLDFMIHEMLTTEKATVPAVVATTTVHDATYQFEIKYERAGTPNFPARYEYADEAYAKYKDTAPLRGCAGDITGQ